MGIVIRKVNNFTLERLEKRRQVFSLRAPFKTYVCKQSWELLNINVSRS